MTVLDLGHIGTGDDNEIADEDLDDEGAIAMANMLTTNTTLEELDLSSSGWISSTGWRVLCSSLSYHNTTITTLNLSY
eukprot:CAMPEP_0172318682 /NCGR_PEP_ID=MMETSP1058-20130122/35537_1 /TAXON_ID=83371 /ORGANISM="Detonula confervacea, Strain CCMP 353" /LENGTH=77 /DNA_ID=CAMNT_0013033563 /DNA_START=26 /DNA_END=256 /DNA_ORIENTATION=+